MVVSQVSGRGHNDSLSGVRTKAQWSSVRCQDDDTPAVRGQDEGPMVAYQVSGRWLLAAVYQVLGRGGRRSGLSDLAQLSSSSLT